MTRRQVHLANFGDVGGIHAYDRDPLDLAAQLLALARRQGRGPTLGWLVRRADGGAESFCRNRDAAQKTLRVYGLWMLDHPELIPATTISGAKPALPPISGADLGDLSPRRSHAAAGRLSATGIPWRNPAAPLTSARSPR